MVNAGDPVYFLGIKVQLLSYTSSVIPIILSIWVASYVQRFFEKYLPIVIRNLFTPMFTIAIMVPLTLLAFGPVGNAIGGAIGGIYNTCLLYTSFRIEYCVITCPMMQKPTKMPKQARTGAIAGEIILVLTTGETATYVLGSIPTLKQEK